jgi:hypothetical protein
MVSDTLEAFSGSGSFLSEKLTIDLLQLAQPDLSEGRSLTCLKQNINKAEGSVHYGAPYRDTSFAKALSDLA